VLSRCLDEEYFVFLMTAVKVKLNTVKAYASELFSYVVLICSCFFLNLICSEYCS